MAKSHVDEELARATLATNPESWIRIETARMRVRSGTPQEAEAHVRTIAEDESFPDDFPSAALDVMVEVIRACERWDDAEKWLILWHTIDASDPLIALWRARRQPQGVGGELSPNCWRCSRPAVGCVSCHYRTGYRSAGCLTGRRPLPHRSAVGAARR